MVPLVRLVTTSLLIIYIITPTAYTIDDLVNISTGNILSIIEVFDELLDLDYGTKYWTDFIPVIAFSLSRFSLTKLFLFALSLSIGIFPFETKLS